MKTGVGIVGCGFIGCTLAEYIARKGKDYRIAAVFDKIKERSLKVAKLAPGAKITSSIEETVSLGGLVIEAADKTAARKVLREVIKRKKSALIMTVGALIGGERLLSEARKAGAQIYLPSGAVSGIDAIKAARMAGIKSVTLTTIKPAKGLGLGKLKKDVTVFEGSAKEAIRRFPKNINVSALISLAGIGAVKTRVRIVASARNRLNTHEIEITGKSGRIATLTENAPSPENPKTSMLAAYSAMAVLESIKDGVHIGT